MKAIYTTNLGGVCRATDHDGNNYRESSYEYSYDEAHYIAALGLCRKMNWTGVLQGSYVIKRGQNVGMVWVWEDPSYRVIIAPFPEELKPQGEAP